MKKKLHFLVYAGLLLVTTSALAQDGSYRRNTIAAGFLYEATASVAPSYLGVNNSIGWSADYGYRPKRWLMLEAGLEHVPRPTDGIWSSNGLTEASDNLFLVPFGARYVLEPRSARVRLSAGAGGAYMNYHVGNPLLLTGETVWGTQGVAAIDYAFTRSRRWHAGASLRIYHFKTGYQTYNLVTVGPNVSYSF